MTVTSTNQKVQFNGTGSTTVFAYNFKIFAQTDLSVILRSATGAETPQQTPSNYTVSGVGAASGGNVTMGVAPPVGTTLTILRVQPNLQGLDLVPNDPFPAGSMEDALDKLTFMVQTHDEEIGRSIKASKTNVIADSEFTVSATDRANKLFSFDSSGNLSIAQELGTFRGNWAANTAYAVRDLVKDTSTGNIFIVITAHTSSGSQPITTNTDAAKWSLIVDAASATTSKNAAAASATASANSATASASSASTSSTKADEAAASASTASTKAGEAASSATASASSATSAASTLTTFQQQYHGAASSNPTSNLTEGDLYFKTGSGGGLRVYNGSAWVTAAFDVSGALINTNNLSDVSNAATALANLGVSSTAAELNTLDALTRGSIIYGNASAATARLAKGAAGTVLTAGANDLSWVAASGGGEQTFTATGAITAGQIVGLTLNGTVSTFSPFNGSATKGTSTIATQLKFARQTYDTTANKLLIASARNATSPYYGYIQICTIGTDNSISIGTEVAFNSESTNMAIPAFDPSNGRTTIVFIGQHNNPKQPKAVSGIVNGSSMTFGSITSSNPSEGGDLSNAGLVLINAGSNKTFAFFRGIISGSSKGQIAYVLTTSGTDLSWGPKVVVDSTSGTNNQRGACYDPDTDRVVLFYVNGNFSVCIVGTVSGSSISFGSAIDMANVGDGYSFINASTMHPVYDTNANKVVFAFSDTSNGSVPTVLVGTVSGTTISFGNPTVINALETCGDIGAAFNSDTNNVELNYTGSKTGSLIQTVRVSGTIVTAGQITAIPNGQVVGGSGGVTYDPDTSRLVVTKVIGSNQAESMVVNPNAPVYVGVAKENISNGASGTVTVSGGINESQSNLVAGFPYGLPTSGSAVVAGPANKIGRAISASKLYISEGSV